MSSGGGPAYTPVNPLQNPGEAIAASGDDEAAARQREQKAIYDAQGRLIGHGETQDEADFLKEIVFQSQRHGKDIEATIEYLSELLRKKSVECEGLKTLAQENYDPVRRAVRREYDARVQSEAKQQTQMRALMKRVEDLQAERQTLQQEVSSLKALVSELERTPPPSAYDEFDKSLFNRVVYEGKDGEVAANAGGGGGDDKNKNIKSSASPGKPGSGSGGDGGSPARDPNASWSLASGGSVLNSAKHQTQRDVLSGLSGLDTEIARELEKAQVFDFIKAILVRMCTRMPNGAFPDLTTVITSILRERRNDPKSLVRVAAQSIPVAEVTDRQRVTQLFLANNPGQLQQLEMLLAQYHGRENELYENLRERFYTEEGKGIVASNLQQHPSVIPSTTDATKSQALTTDPATELHARIMLMYKKYNPAKLASKDLNVMLAKYPPEILLSALVEKYGPEPSPVEKRELLRSLVEPAAV